LIGEDVPSGTYGYYQIQPGALVALGLDMHVLYSVSTIYLCLLLSVAFDDLTLQGSSCCMILSMDTRTLMVKCSFFQGQQQIGR